MLDSEASIEVVQGRRWPRTQACGWWFCASRVGLGYAGIKQEFHAHVVVVVVWRLGEVVFT